MTKLTNKQGITFFLLCLLSCGATTGQGTVRTTLGENRIDVELDGKSFTSFHYNPNWPKPFLHPLRSPSGVEVTRRYPIETVEGESHDHEWHRGLWFAHGDIQGVDFWREIREKQTGFALPVGEIVFRELGKIRGNRVSATYDLMAGGRSLGTMVQTFSFQEWNGHNTVDVEIVVRADKGTCLKFGDTEEGTFGVRLREEFRQDRGATLLNAHGQVGTENIWGKPAPWVDYSSTVEGVKMGVAVFDHPGNPKHPTHWHARGYGLLTANPFGEHDFYGDPRRDGGFTIKEGRNQTFRYRVLIHQGDAREARISAMYERYAQGR